MTSAEFVALRLLIEPLEEKRTRQSYKEPAPTVQLVFPASPPACPNRCTQKYDSSSARILRPEGSVALFASVMDYRLFSISLGLHVNPACRSEKRIPRKSIISPAQVREGIDRVPDEVAEARCFKS